MLIQKPDLSIGRETDSVSQCFFTCFPHSIQNETEKRQFYAQFFSIRGYEKFDSQQRTASKELNRILYEVEY